MARYQPPGSPGTQPRGMLPPRQLPPPDPALRQRALAAFALGVLSLAGLALGLGDLRRGVFVAVLTLLFGVTAIWLGAGANRQARRGGTARPRGATSGIVLGGFGLAFSVLWLLVLAVFWPQLSTYYSCMSGANTVAAQQACHNQFDNSVGSEISVLQNGRLPAAGARPRQVTAAANNLRLPAPRPAGPARPTGSGRSGDRLRRRSRR